MSRCFQQLAQRRTSQMPLPTTESSGAMTDASKRRIEDAEFEVDTEPDWVVGSSFKREDELQDCLRERSQLCFMVSKTFDQRLSEGSCLGLVQVH